MVDKPRTLDAANADRSRSMNGNNTATGFRLMLLLILKTKKSCVNLYSNTRSPTV